MDEETLGQLPNPVLICNDKGSINFINPSGLDLLGYAGNFELKGKSITEILHPEENAFLQKLNLSDQKEPEARHVKQLRFICKDNNELRLLTKIEVLPTLTSRNNSSGWIISAFLPEPAKRGPDQPQCYKLLAENAPGMEMLLVDQSLKIHCSVGRETQIQRWLDDEKKAKKKGIKKDELLDHFPPRINQLLKPLFKIAFDLVPVSRELEEEGNYYFVRLMPIVGENNQPFCVIILQNITETKLVEKKLKASKQEAEVANQAKDNFIAKMSHEIRTPLNAIIGFAEQLEKTRLNKTQAEFLDVVNHSSRHLLSLIEDILVVSRMASDHYELDEEPFHLKDLLISVNKLVELKHKEKGLEYIFHFDVPGEGFLIGDPDKLKQVLTNLINNAIKFTDQGWVKLSCSLVRQTHEKQTIHFEIADTGIGIRPVSIEKIFKPFHQEDENLGRKNLGTGLGLTISKEILEKMGGDLKVKSQPGKGSVFYFTLSFKKTHEQGITYDPEQWVSLPKELPHLKILFVDDDPVNRMLGKVILQQKKIKTIFAATGQEALRQFRTGYFDVVLLDINLPDIQGTEIARRIRQKEKMEKQGLKTRIIAMTANVLRKHIRQYLEAGMDDVMSKPFTEKAIFHKIARNTAAFPDPMPPEIPQNENLQKKVGPDFSELLNFTKGNKEFTMVMLNTFIDSATEMQKKLEIAYEAKQSSEIADIVHRLIPSVEQMGLKRTGSLLKKIDLQNKNADTSFMQSGLVISALEELDAGIKAVARAREDLKK